MKPAQTLLLVAMLMHFAMAQGTTTDPSATPSSSSTTAANSTVNSNVVEETGNPEIYKGLVLGIGPGTFAVVVSAVVAMTLCLFKDAVDAPSVCVGIAICIPIITLIIVRSMPVKSLSSDTEKEDELPTDDYMVRTSVCCGVIYGTAALFFLTLFCSSFITQIMGIRIDSQSLQINNNPGRVELKQEAVKEESARQVTQEQQVQQQNQLLNAQAPNQVDESSKPLIMDQGNPLAAQGLGGDQEQDEEDFAL